ncbi:MAG: LytTR family transcriptional regulator DNA-binding domain-containing protein [Bacteroidales bacterium]|nr:LytTR family transcriptional regulator DNA-binding domain-containing protein [Bacteroidales bacterium]
MAKKNSIIPFFFTDIRAALLFLVSLLVLATIFNAFIRPVDFLRTGEELSNWNNIPYIALQVATGLVVTLVSRYLFYRVAKNRELLDFHFILWVSVELIVMISLLAMVASLTNLGNELNYFDLMWRLSLNLAAMMVVPYIITVLVFVIYDQDRTIVRLSKFADRLDSATPAAEEYYNFRTLGGKLAFSTRRKNVLYLEAADNYCNIHYINEETEDTFILHNSMKRIETSDQYQGLIRCQKGYMVNIENVKSLKMDKDGLMLELTQGTKKIPVSKKYSEAVISHFSGSDQA